MTKQQLEQIGLSLDQMECELVNMQARIYRIRRDISAAVGKSVGYQYDVRYTPKEEKTA